MPDAFVILFFVIVLATLLTWWLPAGQFEVLEKQVDGQTKTLIDPATFQTVEQTSGVPLFASGGEIGLLNYAFEGMVAGSKWGSAIGVMMFIIVVGGAFGIIMKTGAVNNGILALMRKTQGRDYILLPLLFLIFSLGGAVIGMGEEAIAFCILLTPLVVALGYDAICAVMVTYVATQVGFATSWMNPFGVAIAQGLADVPLLSGSEFRMVMWLLFTVAGMVFITRYANRVKANPKASCSPQANRFFQQQEQAKLHSHYDWVDSSILLLLLAGIIWVIVGVIQYGYYIPEIASQFFAMGLVIGVVAVFAKRMRLNDVADAFKEGAKDLLPAAMIVGMAKSIVLILGGDDPAQASTLNTILFYTAQLIGDLPETAAALFMLVFQGSFNFFVASGSGQAALTMPLIAPLSDLVGLTRQVAVLAFQLGDGLTNIIIPTSASLIGCLGVARIDWMIWAKFIWRFLLLMLAMAATFMIIAVQTGF